jgi:hypothetical protein
MIQDGEEVVWKGLGDMEEEFGKWVVEFELRGDDEKRKGRADTGS